MQSESPKKKNNSNTKKMMYGSPPLSKQGRILAKEEGKHSAKK